MKILQYLKRVLFTVNERTEQPKVVGNLQCDASLYHAVHSGDIVQVQRVLRDTNMGSLDVYNKEPATPQEEYEEYFNNQPNPLVEAITLNRLDMVEVLLDYGFSPNSKPRPYNPLLSALLYCPAAIPLLLENGAHPIFKKKNNVNPIDFFYEFSYWMRDAKENKIVEHIENAIMCGQSMYSFDWVNLIQRKDTENLNQIINTFKKHGYNFSTINAKGLFTVIVLNYEKPYELLKLFHEAGVDFNCEEVLNTLKGLPVRPLTVDNTVNFIEWKRSSVTAKNIQDALNEHIDTDNTAPSTRRRM